MDYLTPEDLATARERATAFTAILLTAYVNVEAGLQDRTTAATLKQMAKVSVALARALHEAERGN